LLLNTSEAGSINSLYCFPKNYSPASSTLLVSDNVIQQAFYSRYHVYGIIYTNA